MGYGDVVSPRVIVIDSLDRDLTKYPNPNEYVIKLPDVIRNIESIELMTLQLTRTETNVNSGNNTFKLTINATTYAIAIPIAEYADYASLVTALTTQLNAATSGFTVTYDASIRRLQITHTSRFTIEIRESCSKLLGLICVGGTRGAGTIDSTSTSLYTVTKVALGQYHTVFLLSSNDGLSSKVYACGINESGQLGIGNTTTRRKSL